MATSSLPQTMRAVVLDKYGGPSTYRIGDVPLPQITQSDEILIKVHAAGVNPIDINFANGMVKMALKADFPYVPGFDAAGTIVAVGSSVEQLKVGDSVYTRVPDRHRGTFAEYCLSISSATALKPVSVSFADAAAIPLACLTALQAIRRAEAQIADGLGGKTAFVPGGLSGTGSFALQLLSNVFGVGQVITTLSSGKIAKAKELWSEAKGEITYLDYTKEDVNAAVGHKMVDFMFDTMGNAMGSLALIRSGGAIVTVSSLPGGKEMKERLEGTPWIFVAFLSFINWMNVWRATRYGVQYSYLWMEPDAKGLEEIATWVDEGKVKPIVGRRAKIDDLEGVKEGCNEILKGKGGLGKFVIEII